jgi:hypothetical protein
VKLEIALEQIGDLKRENKGLEDQLRAAVAGWGLVGKIRRRGKTEGRIV